MRSVLRRRTSGNREEGSYVASRNTQVEAIPVVIQEPRESEPIKTKRDGRELLPPYVFLPRERQSGRSPYSLALRRKKTGSTRFETTSVVPSEEGRALVGELKNARP